MKVLLIKLVRVKNCEVVILIDLYKNKNSYIHTSEYNYKEWITTQTKLYILQGYEVINKTDI